MCGLTAVANFGPDRPLVETLSAMHGQIAHRGPDGEGFLVAGDRGAVSARTMAELRARAAEAGAPRAGLAFRWLQIQDRSPEAAQPMASSDGMVRLIFNGEIYNFRDLREELRATGRQFRTASDTEVVIAAYERWGCEMFAKLDGMWAMVLLDLGAGKLVLSRDRYGIKPLFHHVRDGQLLVASEVKQLLAAGAPATANLPAVRRFVGGRRPVSPEETFFDSVCAFPAASFCELDLRSPQPQLRSTPYWTLPRAGSRRDPAAFEQASGALDRLCERVVSDHMVAAVPVGILVSGGLDSSIVAACSAPTFAARGERGVGFSMTLASDGGALDETPYIEAVEAKLGFRGYRAELAANWVKAEMGRLTRVQEEPVAGIAVAGQYLTHALAAEHGVRVVLDGQGADELFGGYPRHQFALLRQSLRRHAWGDLVLEGLAVVARDPALLPRMLKGFLPAAQRADQGLMREAPSEPGDRREASLEDTLRRDMFDGNVRTILAFTDRNSMAHSIEARVPYISREMVEFAFALPDRYKVGCGLRKRILRKVGEGRVPAQVTRRRDRIGFGAPVSRWLRREFAADLRELPRGDALAASRFLDRTRLAQFIEGFAARRHEDAGTVWRLFALDHWVRAYSVSGL